MIGDTPLDIECARAFGAVAVAVATGFHPRTRSWPALGPDLLFDDFADVEAAAALLAGRASVTGRRATRRGTVQEPAAPGGRTPRGGPDHALRRLLGGGPLLRR